ncbi:MAG TPA: isocitrate lyase/PEP mutase family protein, partial [Hyphomicrobiaceae bacterium]|nr:isocitrate lyase/PEP mutase family protein [Hyphomicrobiaceae bacterium]
LEAAGVSGLSIEDTELPRPYGPSDKQRLLSIEEGVGKMKAALAGRRDPDLVIAGRTSAPQLTDIDDAIRRCRAYEAVGVDCIFLVGVKTRVELDKLAAALSKPLILGTLTAELHDNAYLASRRVRVALLGHQPFQAAMQAIHQTMKALREGTPPGKLQGMPPAELVRRITRQDEYDRATRDWLGGKA